jgi:hypothetical protein
MRRDLLARACRLWRSGDKNLDRYNRRAWLRSVRILGDKWILARPINERQTDI